MAVEWPIPFELVLFIPGLVGGILLVARVGPMLIGLRRQAAYEQVVAAELVRLQIAMPRADRIDPDATLELVRALHPRHRRGVDAWAVGWPTSELRAVWRDGRLSWQIDVPQQLLHAAATALRTSVPEAEVYEVERTEQATVACAVGRLTAPGHWPLGDPDTSSVALLRLGGLAEPVATGAEVRLRIILRPIPPNDWHGALFPEERGPSIAGMIGSALLDAIFNRPTGSGEAGRVELSPAEREARSRKRRAQVGFTTQLRVEVAGIEAAAATALLWRVVDFSDSVGDGRQAIEWTIQPPGGARTRRLDLGDWEVAKLWELPDGRFEAAALPHLQASTAPPAPQVAGDEAAITVGETRHGSLRMPLTQLSRHLAVIGATGSGKSTLLLNLALGVLDTPAGATVVDPHGDLTADILSRIPERHMDRVHVLRLADRSHPRGFNFLERHAPDEAQLVTSEFVGLLADLWPRYCGPKMQHYLRNGSLTLLAHPDPQTILELVRILTDDAFRLPYMAHVHDADDAMLVEWWRTQWPSGAARERDPSIGAVLNKLGAFVSYRSIRDVVGQGTSTIRPRQVMDAGDLLLVDLSRVGSDNADLFGAMLISRYYIDAVGRGELPPGDRRPHLLIVDEAQRFATRSIDRIGTEGRKFGLALALATQTLGGLNERLRSTLLTNVATIAALSPGPDDARGLARLFSPLSEDRLLSLERHELALRMPGPDGRPSVYGGRVSLPAPGDATRTGAIIAKSDARDARSLDAVRDEIRRRTAPRDRPKSRPRGTAESGDAE